MGLGDLFASNALVQMLRGDSKRHDLSVTMTGVKLGERLLLVGCRDGSLLSALGAKTGLSGLAVAVDRDAALAQAAGRQAERAGVLAETMPAQFPSLPLDAAAFDVAVVADLDAVLTDATDNVLPDLLRVLREGGRVVVFVPLDRKGDVGTAEAEAHPLVARARTRLATAGFRGARVLAARDGLAYVEGARPRQQPS
ncbi:MAG: methyltransferase domain-containing protein [Vicinamibacterales bacterium]